MKAQTKPFTIAIDGPSGAGKSTVAALVASSLGFLYIDSGAMYRAATWLVLENDISLEDRVAIVKLISNSAIKLEMKNDVTDVFVNGLDVTTQIRSQAVTHLVSYVSAIPGVRKCLVEQQKSMASKGCIVMDGRDIGTVVLPNAQLKIFLTASPEVRAKRRMKDLDAIGENTDFDVMLTEINERDKQDSTRVVAPLRQAHDAIAINTDNLTIEEVVQQIINFARSKLSNS